MPRKAPRLWIHCSDPGRLTAANALAARLSEEWPKYELLLTLPEEVEANAAPHLALRTVPPEKTGAIKAFLEAWQPALVIWMEGHLRPLLLQQIRERGIPALMIDANVEHLPQPAGRWIPLRHTVSLAHFAYGLAVDGPSAQRLTRLGLERVETTGHIDPLPGVLRCHEAERSELAESIGARPVWLACDIPMSELGEVIQAHRMALRGAHRLLLLLQPSLTAPEDEVRRRLEAAGFNVAERANDDPITEGIDVFLVDSAFELGLWYRLASITFMGGTLSTAAKSRSPYEPAALGSAIIAGPQLFPYGSTYLKLERAGGAKLVRSGQDLAREIDHLLSPEAAAKMAHAAWDVVTAGAESTNRLIELVTEILEAR